MSQKPQSPGGPRSAQESAGAQSSVSRWRGIRRLLGWAYLILSLALLALSAWLWARTSGGGDIFWYRYCRVVDGCFEVKTWEARTRSGRVLLTYDRDVWRAPPSNPGMKPSLVGFTWRRELPPLGRYDLRFRRPEAVVTAIGFDAADKQFGRDPRDASRAARRIVGVSAPLWFVCGILSIAPTCALLRSVRRAWRRSRTRCAACGYDLRARHRICPECGAPTFIADQPKWSSSSSVVVSPSPRRLWERG